jgi:hypothetical protein
MVTRVPTYASQGHAMKRWIVLRIATAAFAVIVLAACDDSHNVVGPLPTRTPTPVPLGGVWTGIFSSSDPVLCSQTSPGPARADLVEAGAAVTGRVEGLGGACALSAALELTRTGNDLEGVAREGSRTGAVTGSLTGDQLTLTIEVLSDPTGHVPGGTAELRRP